MTAPVIGVLLTLLIVKERALKGVRVALSASEGAQADLIRIRAEFEGVSSSLGDAKAQLSAKDSTIEVKGKEIRHIQGKLCAATAQLEAEKSNTTNLLELKDQQIEDQLKLIEEAKLQLKDVFASTASDSLRLVLEDYNSRTKSDHSLQQQKLQELIRPIGEGLDKLGKRCEETDKVLAGVQAGLSEQVKSMLEASTTLSNALRRPHVRGSWGELTLRNALSESGLVEGIDYVLQDTQSSDDGRLRADAVVYLPQGQRLVIDSKTPLETFREAIAESDADRKAELFKRHAQGVRKHIADLAAKDYQAQYEGADFVIMFMPTEAMYQAAVEHDPGLLCFGHERRVYIANPITLLGVLRATAHVMSLVRSNDEAQNIRKLGEDLYRSFGKFAGTYAKVGAKLAGVVKEYNESVGSLEGNLLSKARRFKGLGVAGPELPDSVAPVELTVRELCKPELVLGLDSPESELEAATATLR